MVWVFQKDQKWFLEARTWILGQNCDTCHHGNMATIPFQLFGTGESKVMKTGLHQRPVCVFRHVTTGKQKKVKQAELTLE